MAQEWPVSSEDALYAWARVDAASCSARPGPSASGGGRGLLATRELEAGATALVLPWRSVLGARAAVALLRAEEERGRALLELDAAACGGAAAAGGGGVDALGPALSRLLGDDAVEVTSLPGTPSPNISESGSDPE